MTNISVFPSESFIAILYYHNYRQSSVNDMISCWGFPSPPSTHASCQCSHYHFLLWVFGWWKKKKKSVALSHKYMFTCCVSTWKSHWDQDLFLQGKSFTPHDIITDMLIETFAHMIENMSKQNFQVHQKYVPNFSFCSLLKRSGDEHSGDNKVLILSPVISHVCCPYILYNPCENAQKLHVTFEVVHHIWLSCPFSHTA